MLAELSAQNMQRFVSNVSVEFHVAQKIPGRVGVKILTSEIVRGYQTSSYQHQISATTH